ncbi:chemotaxis protein CheW [Pseudanabaena sp. UWO310]|uniref:chemotaxis protein CheW n=1 Tax=Pseudanabaena sp. UWO310 TaxID=2480795 RepID=UPI001681599F|nr:chemotaxis protein CheW [Pseudanabaena sp. UWO310]
MSNLTIELREEKSQAIAGLPYLSLYVERNINVAVQLKFIRETLTLGGDRFTQMPNVHSCLIGLVEHRSNVFWVLDLPQLLGFESLDSTTVEKHIAVLQIADMFLGLAVYSVSRVLRFTETDIVSPLVLPNTKAALQTVPFLKGCVMAPDGNNSIYVLDAEAIANFNFAI